SASTCWRSTVMPHWKPRDASRKQCSGLRGRKRRSATQWDVADRSEENACDRPRGEPAARTRKLHEVEVPRDRGNPILELLDRKLDAARILAGLLAHCLLLLLGQLDADSLLLLRHVPSRGLGVVSTISGRALHQG